MAVRVLRNGAQARAPRSRLCKRTHAAAAGGAALSRQAACRRNVAARTAMSSAGDFADDLSALGDSLDAGEEGRLPPPRGLSELVRGGARRAARGAP